MPSPYSLDLRKRVMEHYEKYRSPKLTSETFKISISTVNGWKRLKKTTGDIKAKEGYQKGHSHKIKLEAFKEIVESNPGLTLEGIVKRSGISMSLMTCSRALKKLNITRKKRPMDLKNEMRKKEKLS